MKLGPLSLDIGKPALPGSCTPDLSIAFTNVGGRLGPLTFSAVSGTLTAQGLTLSSGSVAVGAAWHLGTAAIASPIVVSFGPLSITGSIAWSGQIPFLKLPGGSTGQSTTIALATDQLSLNATAPVAGARSHFRP